MDSKLREPLHPSETGVAEAPQELNGESLGFARWREARVEPGRKWSSVELSVWLGLVVLLGLACAAIDHFAYSKDLGPLIPALASAPIFFWVQRHTVKSESDDLLRMGDIPAPVPQFPVRITLSTLDTVYGQDRGLITFVADMMLFSGTRVDFCLRKEGNLRSFSSQRRQDGNACYTVRFLAGGIDGEMEIFITERRGGELASFNQTLREWRLSSEKEEQEGIVQPPITPTRYCLQTAIGQARHDEVLSLSIAAMIWCASASAFSRNASIALLPMFLILGWTYAGFAAANVSTDRFAAWNESGGRAISLLPPSALVFSRGVPKTLKPF